MILKYTIPKRVEEVIALEKDERIYYAVPYDIAKDASFLSDSYLVVVVLNKRYRRRNVLHALNDWSTKFIVILVKDHHKGSYAAGLSIHEGFQFDGQLFVWFWYPLGIEAMTDYNLSTWWQWT